VDRIHPLSGTPAELRRSSRFLRLPLRGLTVDEVQRMLASISQQQIPWRFAELVHRQTEGNRFSSRSCCACCSNRVSSRAASERCVVLGTKAWQDASPRACGT